MGKERPTRAELDPQILALYAKTFILRRDLYPIQLDNGTYVLVQTELTGNTVAAHLKGYVTIGAYALDPHGWAKWICFDADDEKRWKGLLRLAKSLERASIAPYLESSRRGGHLWLFTAPIPGFQIRRFGGQLLMEHKVPLKKGKSPGVEIYPKHF